MWLYSEVKEIVNDVKKIGKDNIETKKIVDLLKIVSFLVVCATFHKKILIIPKKP